MDQKFIVLIDNDVDDLDILENVIVELDPQARCLSFVFADEAIRTLRDDLKTVPDYIFIDVNMSRKTGPEVLTELRDVQNLQTCKIIMFSGMMPTSVGEAFKKLGAFDYFQKPLSGSEYKRKVSGIFNRVNAEVLTIVA